jgi:hypothetical protein
MLVEVSVRHRIDPGLHPGEIRLRVRPSYTVNGPEGRLASVHRVPNDGMRFGFADYLLAPPRPGLDVAEYHICGPEGGWPISHVQLFWETSEGKVIWWVKSDGLSVRAYDFQPGMTIEGGSLVSPETPDRFSRVGDKDPF